MVHVHACVHVCKLFSSQKIEDLVNFDLISKSQNPLW